MTAPQSDPSKPASSKAQSVLPSLSVEFLRSMLIRWSLAEEYVAALHRTDCTLESALRSFILSDAPALFSELERLRPELDSR